MAWETLDALLVTPIGLANIPEPTIRELWATGVTLVVIGGREPSVELRWKNETGFWIAPGMKPLPAQVNTDAYGPTLQWIGGKSFANRWDTVLLGAIFGILMGGICLLNSRAGMISAVLLSCVFWYVADSNNQRYSPTASAEGIVRLDVGRNWCVDDVWMFAKAHRDTEFDLAVSGSAHPMMMDEDQWSAANLVLTCGSDGIPVAIHGSVKADEPIAMVMRRIGRADSLAGGPVDSPMRMLVTPGLYADYFVAGQRGPDEWNAGTSRTHFGTIVLRPVSSP